jgi:membrane protein YqaA with SNARE-associated domain
MPDNSLVGGEQPAAHPSWNTGLPWSSIALLLGTLAITALTLLIPARFVARLGAYGYLGLFALTLLANATVILPTPALGAALIGGAALNPWLVGLVTGVAAGLGEITGYLAGRGGSALVAGNRYYLLVEHWMRRYGMLAVFSLAFVPGPLLDVAGLVAGSTRVPFWKFLLPCLLGKTLRYMLVAWIGKLAL